jgi:hypothetical protein
MHLALQASLRAALRHRCDCETVGPFLAALDPDSDPCARARFGVASEIVFVSLPA